MKRSVTILTALALSAGAAMAEDVAPADVVFDDDGAVAQSLTGAPGDPAKGAEVMGNKSMGNCVACHVLSSLDASFQGNVGPELNGVGDRWEEAQLRGILTNAKNTFPDTVMPAYYKVDGFTRPGDAFTGKAAEGPLEPLLTAQQIEDVIAFLMTQK